MMKGILHPSPQDIEKCVWLSVTCGSVRLHRHFQTSKVWMKAGNKVSTPSFPQTCNMPIYAVPGIRTLPYHCTRIQALGHMYLAPLKHRTLRLRQRTTLSLHLKSYRAPAISCHLWRLDGRHLLLDCTALLLRKKRADVVYVGC